MSDRSPTPDLLPRFHKPSKLGHASNLGARDNRPQIVNNAQGPKCHLDGPASSAGARRGGHLGTGSDTDAAGALRADMGRAPRVAWGSVMSAVHRRNVK
jgi:hypothetical protein